MKILICHDGSEPAETAMRLGVTIAAGCRADVTLFGIVESPGKSPEILESLRRGQALLEEKKIHAELLTKTGKPIQEIVRRTTECPCDLVVIGAARKSRSGLFRLSSRTYKLIREISPPVLAVAGKKAPTVKRLLVFSGGKRYREAAMRLTGEIARGLGASTTLLHVLPEVPGIYANLRRMEEPISRLLDSHTELGQSLRREKEALESFGLAVEVGLRRGDVLQEMLREIRRGGYELVVVGSALSRGLHTYMLGDISREIVNHASCAVLVVREPPPADEPQGGFRGLFGRLAGG